MQQIKGMNKRCIQQKKMVRQGRPGCFGKIEQAGIFSAKRPVIRASPVNYLTKNEKMAMKAMTTNRSNR